ncbi:MAG: hypothetical protein NC102_06905 [Clostridium sp.]|nr:hypothetical protein [Clostridium sp.]
MRNFILTILGLALMAPATALGQANVKKAFEKLIENKHATVTETHELEKDPQTGEQLTMADVYDFTIPSTEMTLITNIEKAFKQDSEKAYGYYSGSNAKEGAVEVSSGRNKSTNIIPYDKSTYTYAVFLDPTKPENNYRYAYCLSYCKTGDNLNEIKGRLTITYSTTLQYRQSQAENNQWHATMIVERNWIEKFFDRVGSIEFLLDNGAQVIQLQPTIAALYKLSGECPSDLSKQDREMALSIISDLLKNPDLQHATLQRLLQTSFDNINKQ